jgi:4-hydroxybenzoate polyprenyltransferase
MPASATAAAQEQCIVVDLDGTLVRTDTFVASVLESMCRRPSSLWSIARALVRGRAFAKRLAAMRGTLDVTSLPYNQQLLQYLREQKAAGCRLILATGADSSIATDVAAHLQIFDEVISSDGETNVTGERKARVIKAVLGSAPFTYAGNSHTDLSIWLRSQSAILVDAPTACSRKLAAAGISVQREFKTKSLTVRLLSRCIRVHQWSKNILILLPLVLAHQVLNPVLLVRALVSFLAFSFCASSLYILNDLLDSQADRLHPTKRSRPLASGEISVGTGIAIGLVLLAAAIVLSLFLPAMARILLAGYAVFSFTYSFVLKRMLFLDVVSLALLYALRVLYGGAATGIKISVWTGAFCLFLFTSLAALKRLAELRRTRMAGANGQNYRGYREADVNQLASLASAGGYVAILVLALYINSSEVMLLYSRPEGLWLLCPILIYWFSRLALIANRGDLNDDPVAFALKDKATWLTGALALIVLIFSTYHFGN